MKTRGWKIEDDGWRTRSVMECGGPPPLLASPVRQRDQSSRGLAQSKTSRLRLALSCLLPLAFCLCAQAQYSLDWSTLEGGGGTSTGGGYTVTGTIGQPDAGRMSGGNFTLEGGFWGVIAALQTPGAPLLSVVRTATNTVVVAWPLPATGWVLEQTPTVNGSPPPWTPVPAAQYQTNATHCFISVLSPAGNHFYRLRLP